MCYRLSRNGSDELKQKPLWLKWIFCLIPLIIAASMYFLLPLFPAFTEYVMSQGVFRVISFPLQWIMSALPFSFTELIAVSALPLLLTLITVWIIRIIKKQNRAKVFEKGVRFTAWCVNLALLVFMVMDGANFYRLPLSELLSLPNRQYTAEDLYIVTCDIADKAAKARESLSEDENGCAVLSVSETELLKLADNCYDNIGKDYSFLKTGVWRVKPVALSRLWSYTGTTGVYCPWTSEANVNTDVPVYSIPHTAAHEIAHTMGFAKENECNFLAFIACGTSGMPDFEYSGYFAAYKYCINALYRADKELWKEATEHCSDGMIRDLKNETAYWSAFEGETREVSQNLNDSFIKSNRVESGILSYNQMVELLLRFYDIDVI